MAESWARTQASRLALVIAALAFGLIVVAGIELGTGDIDAAATSFAPRTTIETTQLVVALLTATATFALVGLAWLRLRADARVARAASVSTLLIVIQLLAMAVSRSAPSAAWATAVHFGATALLLATALALACSNRTLSWVLPAHGAAAHTGALARLVGLTLAGVFAVLVSGAYLGAAASRTDCTGWPLCTSATGELSLLQPQNAHRALVGVAGVLLVGLAMLLFRSRARLVAPLALLTVFVAEALVGAVSAGGAESSLVSGTHFAAAGAAWTMLVVIGLAIRPAVALQRDTTVALSRAWRNEFRDYLRVTKPGIMTLLLITTLGAMLIAPGWPTIWLVLATLAGGALASGGASALNCYLDRDIDVVMARTRKRPLPTGTLSPAQVRNFGLLLSAVAVIELWLLVNPVAALLALGGNVFYVVIYTRYLKRSTPQNIVIGGAAGAFPPLVGWAAVTGSVNLTAILLFALIYYWTPPHFWSLALLKARDYERASIPMLPVTHGEHQTRKHILLYSLMLVAVTLLLVPAGAAGTFYLLVALALGAVFVWLAARMYRERTSRLAWRLFKYSNYYLAAILLAMVLDRAFAG